jgi:hypothetical protein
MSASSAGYYPIEHRDGEIDRLEAQGITFAPASGSRRDGPVSTLAAGRAASPIS